MDERITIADLERRLAESEARHRLVIESWAQAVWETDAGGVVVFDSPSWRAYTGQTLAEWLGYGWLDAIHPEDRLYAERQWREAIASRGLVNAEFRLRSPGGVWRWTNVRAAPILDAAGRIEKWVGINIDIDERKRAEATLRESEQKYRKLFENLGQGYAECELIRGMDGHAVDVRYLALNPALERLSGGLKAADMIGRPAREVIPDLEETHAALYERIVDGGVPERVEYEVAALGRWYESYVYPINGDRFISLYEDITERKRAEARLRESEERQTFLLGLSDALRRLSDPVEVQDVASRMVGEHLKADRVSYSEVEGDELVVHRDYAPGAPSMVGRYPKASFGQKIEEALGSSGMVWANDVQSSQELSDSERAAFRAAGIASYVGSTLYKDGRFAGAFGLHQTTPRNWTEDEITLVEDVAERIWAATTRARMEAALRASEERQAFLLKLSDALRAEDTADAVAALAPRLLADQLALDRCYTAIWRLAEDRVDLLHQINRTDGPDVPPTLRPSDFPDGLTRAIRGTMVVNNAAVEPNLSAQDRQGLLQIGLNAFVAASLHKGAGNPIFVVMAASARERSWSSGEVALIEEAAERTWAAMERARADAAMRQSEARLAAAFESVPVGVAVVGLDGSAMISNAEYRRFLPSGIIPSRDPARTARWRAWDAEGRQLAPAEFPGARAIRGETVVPGQEMLHTQDDGRENWTSVATAPTRDESGRVTGLVTAISDIDAAKRGADALRESKERQAFLLRLSDALRPLADPQEIKDAATRVLGEHLGVLRAQYWEADETAEFLDSTGGYADGVAPVTAHIRMDDFGLYVKESYRAGTIMAVPDVASDPRVSPEELKAYEALGFRAWAGVPLVKNGRLVAALGLHHATRRAWTATEIELARETAERTWAAVERAWAEAAVRQSEERLRQFGEASSDVLWIRDVETYQWMYLTPAFEAIYGIDRAAALAGDNMANWVDLIEPEDRERAIAGLRRVSEGERVSFEYRIRRPRDGAIRWLRNTDFPMRDAAGKVRWIGGVGRDITDEKETADRMQVLVAELQHRTRNLMGVVRSTAEKTMARSNDLFEFRGHFGDRLSALARVQGLLSRLGEWDRVTFDELIRSELSAIDGEAERISLDGPKGVALRSSTVQTFALALHELMTNALKYGALAQPQGRLAIVWRLERAETDGRPWLHVDWRESGVTMPAVSTVKGGGSGRELITRALPYQLKAITTYVMGEDGVQCTIALPVSERGAGPEATHA